MFLIIIGDQTIQTKKIVKRSRAFHIWIIELSSALKVRAARFHMVSQAPWLSMYWLFSIFLFRCQGITVLENSTWFYCIARELYWSSNPRGLLLFRMFFFLLYSFATKTMYRRFDYCMFVQYFSIIYLWRLTEAWLRVRPGQLIDRVVILHPINMYYVCWIYI